MNDSKISQLIEDNGYDSTCADCQYYTETVEHHPYGMGTAAETLGECTCQDDNECPRLNHDNP